LLAIGSVAFGEAVNSAALRAPAATAAARR
jgi:hypothetical protein